MRVARQAIVVQGNGSVGQLLTSMVNATNTTNEVIPDPSFCLPRVRQPAYQQYSRIGKAYWLSLNLNLCMPH